MATCPRLPMWNTHPKPSSTLSQGQCATHVPGHQTRGTLGDHPTPHTLTCWRSNMWIKPTQGSLTVTWQLAQGCPCGILIQSHHQHCHMDNVLHMYLVRRGEPSETIQLLTCWLAQGQTCELNRPKAVSQSHGNLPKVTHVEFPSKAIINTVTWTMCYTCTWSC